MSHEPVGRPRTPDLPPADLVYVWLNRGRDNAESIGSLAERLRLTRRQVEQAVTDLRRAGHPVASGAEGIWLGDAVDMEQTYRTLRGRIESQSVTAWAVRRTLRQMRDRQYQQQTLGFGEAA